VWVEPRLLAAQPGHWLGANDQAGLAGSSPAHVGWARPSPKKKKRKKKRVGRIWALGSADPNYVY